MKTECKIGIIGCGNMGEAIAKGIVYSKVTHAGNLYLYDIDKRKSDFLKETLNANVTNSTMELVNSCETILLAVKPQDIEEPLRETWHLLDSTKLIISIIAGITIGYLKRLLKEEVRIVRVMPNMAVLVNQGISALCYDNYAGSDDKELTREIFMSIGDIVEIEEVYMDAVTAISGSGPAYFFYLAEILEKSAIDMGIDKDKAKLLANKTAFGSASLLKDSGFDAETLRKRVTSKGGTTEAAFRVFQDKKLQDILQKGIEAAKKRAEELSEGS
jgi:pyrroline-5-carboxylate reductase